MIELDDIPSKLRLIGCVPRQGHKLHELQAVKWVIRLTGSHWQPACDPRVALRLRGCSKPHGEYERKEVDTGCQIVQYA